MYRRRVVVIVASLIVYNQLSQPAKAQTVLIPNPGAGGAYEQDLSELRQEVDLLRQQLQGSRVSLASAVQNEPACSNCQGATCGNCNSNCDDCRQAHWYAGVEFAFLRPYLKESFQASRIDLQTGVQSLYGFDYEYEFAPRGWIGWEDCDGLGLRARYEYYDHSGETLQLTSSPTSVVTANAVTVIFPATINSLLPGDVLTANSSLALKVLDIEGTQTFQLGPISGRAGAGLRYLQIRQDNLATIDTPNVGTQTLAWGRSYDGLGPVMSADVLRPLGCGGWGAYGTLHAALTFGEKTLTRTVTNNSFPPTVTLADAAEVVGGGSVALGVQYTREVDSGSWQFRGGYEGQLWTDAGAPTLTFLGFEGFSFSLAFTR